MKIETEGPEIWAATQSWPVSAPKVRPRRLGYYLQPKQTEELLFDGFLHAAFISPIDCSAKKKIENGPDFTEIQTDTG